MEGYTTARTWSLPISHLYINMLYFPLRLAEMVRITAGINAFYMLYFPLRLAEIVRITAGINAFNLDFSSVRILTMYIATIYSSTAV